MERLQQRCLIGTAGMHLLLVLILVVGPGFFKSKPKVDDTPILEMIPSSLTDKPLNSGVKNPTPPQPTVTPPPPTPEPPKPVVKPVEPDEPTPPEKPSPEALVPVKKPAKPKEHKVDVDLKHVVHRKVKSSDNSEAEAEAERKAEQRRLAHEIAIAAHSIEKHASSATEVSMPGTSSVSYANYALAVRSLYDRAWTAPDDAVNDDANTVVKVVVASDGTVVSARITTPSGDAKVDGSVQRALDSVTFIGPFPEGATEKTRTFIINFNLKSKRQIG